MKMRSTTHFVLLIILYFSFSQFAQSQTLSDTVKNLYLEKKYDEALAKVKSEKKLNASGLFYAGLCYYAKQEDQRALYCFNRATEKDPTNAEYFFYQGSSLSFLKRYAEAVNSFKNAIKNKADSPLYFVSLGDAYYNQNKLDSAVVAYSQAIPLEKCPPRALMMKAQTLNSLKKTKESLEAYYYAKQNLDTTSEYYQHALYDIGLLEYQLNNFAASEKAFVELLDLSPKNYNAISLLIQTYYAEKSYDKAKVLKAKLYEGYKNKELPEGMQEMFCFDQFTWKHQKVAAFEKFEQPKAKGNYYKHFFILRDEQGNVKNTIHTENSFAVEAEGKKYVLGSISKGIHHTYWQFLWVEDFDYAQLKNAVIQILEGKAKPSSTSSIVQDK